MRSLKNVNIFWTMITSPCKLSSLLSRVCLLSHSGIHVCNPLNLFYETLEKTEGESQPQRCSHAEVFSVQVQLINDAYNLVIDAMLGPEADCANIKEPYSGILVTLKQISISLVSVDVPTGKSFTLDLGQETSHDRWASRQLFLSLGSHSQACFLQVWRHMWRINLMLQLAQCELIVLQIHCLLDVSTRCRI